MPAASCSNANTSNSTWSSVSNSSSSSCRDFRVTCTRKLPSYGQRKRVPEFTSVRDEKLKILANSCISKMDRIGMRKSRKPCAVMPSEGWRHAVSKFRRAVSMERAEEER